MVSAIFAIAIRPVWKSFLNPLRLRTGTRHVSELFGCFQVIQLLGNYGALLDYLPSVGTNALAWNLQKLKPPKPKD